MKKIMFNDKYGLTEAVLTGRKTMTRRAVTLHLYNQTDWKAYEEGDYECVVDGDGYYHDIRRLGAYQVGEEVAVAQQYKNIIAAITPSFGSPHTYDWLRKEAGWNNKMFVRSDLMPHRIRITDIKVERLQDISRSDIEKEGVQWSHKAHRYYTCFNPITGIYLWLRGTTAEEAFAYLVDRISGRGTWAKNPFVFAYEFELIN